MDAEADPVVGSGGLAEALSPGCAVAVPSVIVVVDGDCVDGPPSEDASRLAAGASSTGQMMNHLLPVCRTEQRKITLIHSYSSKHLVNMNFRKKVYHFADTLAGEPQVAVHLFPGKQ